MLDGLVLDMPATSLSRRSIVSIVIAVAALILVVAVTWWLVASSQTDDQAQPAPAPEITAAEAPSVPEPAYLLPEETSMGVVAIDVRDLDVVGAYYRDVVRLEVLDEGEGTMLLGIHRPLIELRQVDAPAAAATDAGLYHSAILYDDEASLAQVLISIAQSAPESFAGASDHRVSQAFYFADPEGNGIELYVDRPREEWVWESGAVVMGNAALDPNEFINEHLDEEASGAATMGHVHLSVGDLDEARLFYSETLGFDITATSDGALFYSAGGYHHHLATNTWGTEGAGVRGETTGLRSVTVTVPDVADLEPIAERLQAAGIESERAEGSLSADDPWGNTVHIVVSDAG